MPHLKAIVTGYQPFGKWPANPSQDAARRYDGRVLTLDDGRDQIEVVGLVLPVGYYEAFQALDAAMRQHSPDIIVSVGLAPGATTLRLETMGRNMTFASIPDALGRNPQNEPIDPAGEAEYRTNIDHERVLQALQDRGLVAVLSEDAGTYICNATIYQAMQRISRDSLPIRYAFLHTPWTDDRAVEDENLVRIPVADLDRAVETIIRTLAMADPRLTSG